MRQAKRKPAVLKIKFKSNSIEDFIEKYSTNISGGGIFIATKKPLPVGALITFEFQIEDYAPQIKGIGKIVWNRKFDPEKQNQPPGMGIKFIKMDKESKDTLDKILDSKEEIGLPVSEEKPITDDSGILISSEDLSQASGLKNYMTKKTDSGGVKLDDIASEIEKELDGKLTFVDKPDSEKEESKSEEKEVSKVDIIKQDIEETIEKLDVATEEEKDKKEEDKPVEKKDEIAPNLRPSTLLPVSEESDKKFKAIHEQTKEPPKEQPKEEKKISEKGMSKGWILGIIVLLVLTIGLTVYLLSVLIKKQGGDTSENSSENTNLNKNEYKNKLSKNKLSKSSKNTQESIDFVFTTKEFVIETEPEKVRVMINGIDFGRTPATIGEDKIDFTQKLKIRLTTVGHDNWEEEIDPAKLQWKKQDNVLRYILKVALKERDKKRGDGNQEIEETETNQQGQQNQGSEVNQGSEQNNTEKIQNNNQQPENQPTNEGNNNPYNP